MVDAVVPTFTNPNNLSIVTGAPPAVHGICGNYFYDRDAGAEVMMNDPKYLRVGHASWPRSRGPAPRWPSSPPRTSCGACSATACGASASPPSRPTARRVAEHGLDDALGLVGLPLPSVYSAALSEFVFAAGVKLMESRRPDVMYLSTTDYVQHKHAPGTPEANAFYQMMDGYLARLQALGATVGAHRRPRHERQDRRVPAPPPSIYLQDVLDGWLGAGQARVILPITDPYVVHHGALGSFATVYLPADADVAALGRRLAAVPGVEVVLDRAEACARFELPPDRMGDLVVISTRHVVLGTARGSPRSLRARRARCARTAGSASSAVPLLVNRRTPGAGPARGCATSTSSTSRSTGWTG